LEAGRFASVPRENPFRRLRSDPAPDSDQPRQSRRPANGAQSSTPQLVPARSRSVAPALPDVVGSAMRGTSLSDTRHGADAIPVPVLRDVTGNLSRNGEMRVREMLAGVVDMSCGKDARKRRSAGLHLGYKAAPGVGPESSAADSLDSEMNKGDTLDDKGHSNQQSHSKHLDCFGDLFDWVEVAANHPRSQVEAGQTLSADLEAVQLDVAVQGGSLKEEFEAAWPLSWVAGGRAPRVPRSYARVERSGTRSGVALGSTTREGGDYDVEIERALRAAEALVADGRERDVRRVEGRRQRATRTAERLEEVARMALLRLACGRLGAAWHHWSEAAREARNLRVLAERTRPFRAAPVPQMRPQLCVRPFRSFVVDTDSCPVLT
jgi:hypothetical protein